MVIETEVSDLHPVELAKINLDEPPVSPVTNPLKFMLATVGLVDVHVPPDAGRKLVVEPTHIVDKPFSVAEGLS